MSSKSYPGQQQMRWLHCIGMSKLVHPEHPNIVCFPWPGGVDFVLHVAHFLDAL